MSTGQGDSAYKSQTALTDDFWNDYSAGLTQVPQLPLEESTQGSTTTPDVPFVQETTTVTQSTTKLRGERKSRCTPTDDASLLSRDSEKIYQCTRKCGKRYGRKCDWKRNEEEGYPCKSWVCSLCTSEGVDKIKPCFRKYHFAQHFRNIHPGLKCDDYGESSIVSSETEFPRKCGFCKHRFESRQERINHIAEHFKQGKCMLDWNDSDNSGVSDNTDNDDDDRPSDDDSDNSRSYYKPPPNDPRGGTARWYGGGGGDGSGSGSSNDDGSQGGYFQFQLSQLSEGDAGRQYYWASQQNEPTSGQKDQQRTRCASEPPVQRSAGVSSVRSCSKFQCNTSKRCHTRALAGDALPGTLTEVSRDDSIITEDRTKLAIARKPTGVGILDDKNDWLDVLLKSRQRMAIGKALTSSHSLHDTCQQSPTESKFQVLDLDLASPAAPMFTSRIGLASTNSSRSSAIDGSSLSEPLSQHTSTHHSSVILLEPKVTPLTKSRANAC
jgi:hypothetical protein